MPLLVGAFDYLRVASTLGIVWFHAPGSPFKLLCSPALAIFIMMSFVAASQPVPLVRFAAHRSRKILLPWSFWWAFYAAIAVYLNRGRDVAAIHGWSLWTIIGWPAIHLWYLPFLFVTSVALQAARPLFRRLTGPAKLATAFVLGVGILALLPWIDLGDAAPGMRMWLISLPAVGFGIAFGFALRCEPARRRALAGAMALAIVPASIWVAWRGDPFTGVAYGVGSILMALCAFPIPRSRRLARFAGLTFGIYLIHPFMFIITYDLGGGASPWAFIAAGFLGSACCAWAMKRVPMLRAVV